MPHVVIVIRGFCAVVCAVALHAAAIAVVFGFARSGTETSLPELDLASVELSFSETPDETAAPIAASPSAAVEPPLPPPPPVAVQPPPPPITVPDNSPFMADPPVPPVPSAAPSQLPQPPAVEPQASAEELPPPASASAPSVPAPSQARVAAEKQPSPRRRIKPEYPRGARQRGEEGDVELELDVSADGAVDEVRVVASCGFPELEQAAVRAVRRARFTPARRGEKNVPATARITLKFRLRD